MADVSLEDIGNAMQEEPWVRPGLHGGPPAVPQIKMEEPAYDPAEAAKAVESLNTSPRQALSAWERFGKNALTGLKSGLVSEAETWENLATVFSKLTGIEHGEALKQLVEKGKRSVAEGTVEGGDSIVDKVTRSLFASIPTIVQLAAGTGVVGAGLKAAKLPTALKLGETAVTGGKRLLTSEGLAAAQKLAGGKALKGVVNIAEPLAFGAYEAGREAIRPEATLGSTLARGAGGLGMGGALSLTHGLPQVVKQATAAGIGAGATAIEGGTPEQMLESGITMGVLTSLPEAKKAITKVIKGEPKVTPETTPTPEAISDETSKVAQGPMNELLRRRGYSGYDLWSPYQKAEILRLSKDKIPLEVLENGDIQLNLGKYTRTIPANNAKQATTKPVETPEEKKVDETDKVTAEQKGTIQERKIVAPKDIIGGTYSLEDLGKIVLDPSYDYNTRISAGEELSKRQALLGRPASPAKTEAIGPLAGAIDYIENVLKGKKELNRALVDDLRAAGKLDEGQLIPLYSYFRDKGYKIVVSEPKEAVPGVSLDDVSDAINADAYSALMRPTMDSERAPIIGLTGEPAQSRVLAARRFIKKIQELTPKAYRDLLGKGGPERKEIADTMRLVRSLPTRLLNYLPDVEIDEQLLGQMKKWGKNIAWGAKEQLDPELDPRILMFPISKEVAQTPRTMPQVVAHDLGHFIYDRFLAKEPMAYRKGYVGRGTTERVPYEETKATQEGVAAFISQMLLRRAGLPDDPALGHGVDQALKYLEIVKRNPNFDKFGYLDLYRYLQDTGVLKRVSRGKVTEKVPESPAKLMQEAEKAIQEIKAQMPVEEPAKPVKGKKGKAKKIQPIEEPSPEFLSAVAESEAKRAKVNKIREKLETPAPQEEPTELISPEKQLQNMRRDLQARLTENNDPSTDKDTRAANVTAIKFLQKEIASLSKTVEKGFEDNEAKQKRMREWADQFLKDTAAYEGPELSSIEGIKELRRAEMGKVIQKPGKGGIISSKRGGGMVEKGFEPLDSEDALDIGKTIDHREAKRIWDRYLVENNNIMNELKTKGSSQTMLERSVKNQLQREIVESYLGASREKSLRRDQIDSMLKEGVTKGFEEEVETPETLEQLTEAQTKESKSGTALRLYRRSIEKSSLSPEERTNLIKELASTRGFKSQMLNLLGDESLKKIKVNNLTAEHTWGFNPEGERTIALSRVPTKIKSEIQADEKARYAYYVKHMGMPASIYHAIDWPKAFEYSNEGVLDKILGEGISRRVDFEKVSGERTKGATPEEPVTMGKMEAVESREGAAPRVEEGPAFVMDPKEVAGAMLKGMSYKEVKASIEEGRPLPTIPEDLWLGIKEKSSPFYTIKETTVKEWFNDELLKVNKGKPFPKDLTADQELEFIKQAMPGLRSEMLADENMAKISNDFRDSVLKNYMKERGRGSFEEAATNAFNKAWSTWKRMKGIYDTKTGELKSQVGEFMQEMSDIIQETPDTGLFSRKLSELAPEEMENLINIERRVRGVNKGFEPEIPNNLVGVDKDLAEAAKLADPLQEYRGMHDMAGSIVREIQKIIKEDIPKLVMDRDGAKDDATRQAAAAKIGELKARQSQLGLDFNFLTKMMNEFERVGKPYKVGNELFIESTLKKDSDGMDGMVISKATPKGSTFMLIQGPNGGPAKPGEAGHQLVANAEIVSRRTKGEIVSWNVPKDMDKRAEDALYNDILERYMWRKNPIKVTPIEGIATEVAKRRIDTKYKTYAGRNFDDFYKSLIPQDAQLAREMKARQRAKLREVVENFELAAAELESKGAGKSKSAKELNKQFLQRAQSLTDGNFDYDFEAFRKAPEQFGITDPNLMAKVIEYMPLFDRVGDPTQSRVVGVARVGNLAQQAEYAMNHYVTQYVAMAKEYLGPYRNDTEMKQKIMRHLLSNTKGAGKDWKSNDPKVIEAARGYRIIMEDMADLFKLKEKGIYNSDYATINFDMNAVWDSYRNKISTVNKQSELPDSISSKIKPEKFNEIQRIAKMDKEWDKLTPDEQAYVKTHFFNSNLAFDSWETLPEFMRAKIPKQKFIAQWQPRNPDGSLKIDPETGKSLLNEDIWDVTMNYIYGVTKNGVLTDWFMPRATRIASTYGALGANETVSVRGFLDSYIKQVCGFGKSPTTQFMNEVFKTMNSWLAPFTGGKPTFPEMGSMEGIANRYQQWLYRGALGVDTAIRNLTQSIYTIAELGPYNWVKGLQGYVTNYTKNTKDWQRFSERQKLLEEFYGTRFEAFKKGNPGLYDKISEADTKITALALSPMRITEHINRGIAYFAGLQEAAKMGVPFEQGHIVGFGKATQYTHPLEMSEAEWLATQRMYKTQFGYGKVHGSPVFQGTIAKFLTPFWSFPTKSLQFVSNLGKESMGITRWGEALENKGQPFLTSDKGQFARFLALTGFMAFAPTLLAETLGIDASYMWGKGIIPGTIAPAWLNSMENIYVGVLGGPGMSVPPSEKEKAKARKDMWNFVYMMGIPQYRFGAKANRVMENLEKGYYTMGPADLPVAETNFAREVVNLFGFPPMTRDAKQIVYDAYGERADYEFFKQDTLKQASAYWEKGDYNGAAKAVNDLYREKGILLTEEDISDYIRRQNTTSAYAEAAKHVTKNMSPEWKQRLSAAEQKYLPKGPGKTIYRDFWSNTSRPEQQPTPEEPEVPQIPQMGLSQMIGQ